MSPMVAMTLNGKKWKMKRRVQISQHQPMVHFSGPSALTPNTAMLKAPTLVESLTITRSRGIDIVDAKFPFQACITCIDKSYFAHCRLEICIRTLTD